MLKTGKKASVENVTFVMNYLYKLSIDHSTTPFERLEEHLFEKSKLKKADREKLAPLLTKRNEIRRIYLPILKSALEYDDGSDNTDIFTYIFPALIRSPLMGKYIPKPWPSHQQDFTQDSDLAADWNVKKNKIMMTNLRPNPMQMFFPTVIKKIKRKGETEIDTTRYCNEFMAIQLGFKEVSALIKSFEESNQSWHDWVAANDPFRKRKKQPNPTAS